MHLRISVLKWRMLRRFVALLVGGSGAWAIAAGCTASGSNQTLHGPAFDLDRTLDDEDPGNGG